ncbi:hypothetical protein [Ligilactobacillus acidipiscis]|uniref:hypothetical protein n=1 Tax=Ligilactobacillus acidipiscis TaxID=89059 RepID=UPI0012E36C1B|nr:hypothetical protein [Ligilactobacillus acidipiscis]
MIVSVKIAAYLLTECISLNRIEIMGILCCFFWVIANFATNFVIPVNSFVET